MSEGLAANTQILALTFADYISGSHGPTVVFLFNGCHINFTKSLGSDEKGFYKL